MYILDKDSNQLINAEPTTFKDNPSFKGVEFDPIWQKQEATRSQ